MSVYMIAQVTIKNREEYDKYAGLFMGVFEQFEGKVLSVDDDPNVIEGEWTASRSVLLEFPSQAKWEAWVYSPEYQAITEHRKAGADIKTILVKSLGHEE